MTHRINVGDFLTNRAYLNPYKEAVFDEFSKQRYTFSELNRRANQLGSALAECGLIKGDRVAVLAYNGNEFIECFFGAGKRGMVVMPLNWRLTADELSFILKDGGATAIVYDADFASVVADIRQLGNEASNLAHFIEIGDTPQSFANSYEKSLAKQSNAEPMDKAGSDDNLFIMYTSGTTGLPKGVVHTHETVMWAVMTMSNTADIHFNDRYLILLPLFHVGALSPAIMSIYTGNTSVILRNFDPVRTWQLIEEEKINGTLAVPAMLNFMLQVPDYQRYDWSSLRYVMSGAAPVPVATIETYMSLGIEIHQVYGLTESCGPACLIGPDHAAKKVGSCGKSFFHTQVRLIDSSGRDVVPGESGEVLVSGGHIMKEYWNRPEATAETVKDGWLYTGDMAISDEEGFITIQDRIKDMIISGGENVYPAEIENVLMQCPGVNDAAVIGQDSEKWGESPLAIIIKKDLALTEDEVLAHCNKKLARYKIPRGVEFVNEIPRNPSGKILKRVLREQFPGRPQSKLLYRKQS